MTVDPPAVSVDARVGRCIRNRGGGARLVVLIRGRRLKLVLVAVVHIRAGVAVVQAIRVVMWRRRAGVGRCAGARAGPARPVGRFDHTRPRPPAPSGPGSDTAEYGRSG